MSDKVLFSEWDKAGRNADGTELTDNTPLHEAIDIFFRAGGYKFLMSQILTDMHPAGWILCENYTGIS